MNFILNLKLFFFFHFISLAIAGKLPSSFITHPNQRTWPSLLLSCGALLFCCTAQEFLKCQFSLHNSGFNHFGTYMESVLH